MNKSTVEIRQAFLDFFHSKGHQIVASSSLVPENDSTLLFTNAGMNQFKNIFLGLDEADYSRVTTSQRCIRVGGKHNDLENVGYTTRHHTFFEMLGNFSFGDYFKYDAIQYAWELLTSKNFFNLSKERLWITVHKIDDQSYKIWKNKIGIPHERIIQVGERNYTSCSSKNFWQMGDTGPCGPCTEIFYDQGNHIFGSLPGSTEESGDRYIEIWNIVFIQFNRRDDGTMELLPKPFIDTGMGLERIAAILQHANSNYDIDLFRILIEAVIQTTSTANLNSKSLRVVADHIRSCVFLVADGVMPSNEGRGYVLRRIIRRAIRHGNLLGAKDVFFYRLVNPLIEVMGASSIDLKSQQTQIERVLRDEEEKFSRTLERGLSLLNEELIKLKGDTLDGKIAFRLYDTYGFPLDLTKDVCREHNIKVDEVGFKTEMTKQRRQARQHNEFFVTKYNSSIIDVSKINSEFQGYDHLEIDGKVTALFVNNKAVDNISSGQKAIVILDRTSFYPESGGQIGDQGELKGHNFSFVVNDTQKYDRAICHIGKLILGSLRKGDNVKALVDKTRRARICINHTATHLVHFALRKVLGTHIAQKGSLINDKMLRFDFSHSMAMKPTEIRAVENLLNTKIRNNFPIKASTLDIESAKAQGETIFLDRKYHNNKHVRVLKIGDFSSEFCIGTHTSRTGDIGLFRIIAEFSKATGIRRIEAVTGEGAIASLHAQSDQLYDIRKLLKVDDIQLSDKIKNMFERMHQMEINLKKLQERVLEQDSINLSREAIEVKGVKLLVSKLKNVDPKMLRVMVDLLKKRLGSTVIVLVIIDGNKVSLVSGISRDVNDRLKANELINKVAKEIGIKGGGRSEIAQAGGNIVNSSILSTALNNLRIWIIEHL